MDFCEQKFQNIVTWGVKLQLHILGFACFWRAELVVCRHTKYCTTAVAVEQEWHQ